MSGKIHRMINSIIDQRSQGNQAIASTTRTKLMLKGINTANFNPSSQDDPVIIEKLNTIAKELGIMNLN